jgi:hypothetical protein
VKELQEAGELDKALRRRRDPALAAG